MEKEGWRKCPACGRIIERIEDSCNKMTCGCGCVFCWKCGKVKPKGGTGYERDGEGGCRCAIFDEETVRLRVEKRKARGVDEEWSEVLDAVDGREWDD